MIYFIQARSGGPIKIGHAQDVRARSIEITEAAQKIFSAPIKHDAEARAS